jgi:hypothetical protein
MNIKLKILLGLLVLSSVQLNASMRDHLTKQDHRTKKTRTVYVITPVDQDGKSVDQDDKSVDKDSEKINISLKKNGTVTPMATIGIKKDANKEPKGNLYNLKMENKEYNNDDLVSLLLELACEYVQQHYKLKLITIFPASVGLTRKLTSENFQELFDATLYWTWEKK